MRENMKNLSREVSNLKIKSNNVIESCELCGRKGHIGKNCYSRDRKTNENVTAKPSEKNDIVCHRCGFVGHIKRNCMVKEANFKSGFPQRTSVVINPVVRNIQNPSITNMDKTEIYNTDHDRMCFRCEKMGHIAIHCIQSVNESQ
ncbi:DNA-binding protein HEXBP-like [Gordionus sp. m RMFG-2023]|uniref:DNA-binding protein HEXBP-like n=1 Tax=Gordionus sp. m RMFG-2023 TaxID=3053472 RepID=UPI0031FC6416